jgi:hypothetical protein
VSLIHALVEPESQADSKFQTPLAYTRMTAKAVHEQLNIVFGISRDTSDFVADCLELWWTKRQSANLGVRRLLIDLDNGPEIASSRTQFMKRLVEFSDRHELTLELAYYPPYHSKYNPVERCWGILENHWNGTLLTSIDTALEWAKTMTWRGITPIVHLLDGVYETGVRLLPRVFRPIAARLERSISLPKWSLIISPESR